MSHSDESNNDDSHSDEPECIVCQEPEQDKNNPLWLPCTQCQHTYLHQQCFYQMINSNLKNCPTCREPFNPRGFRIIEPTNPTNPTNPITVNEEQFTVNIRSYDNQVRRTSNNSNYGKYVFSIMIFIILYILIGLLGFLLILLVSGENKSITCQHSDRNNCSIPFSESNSSVTIKNYGKDWDDFYTYLTTRYTEKYVRVFDSENHCVFPEFNSTLNDSIYLSWSNEFENDPRYNGKFQEVRLLNDFYTFAFWKFKYIGQFIWGLLFILSFSIICER